MRYPMHKGITEITAYLKNAGTLIYDHVKIQKAKGTPNIVSPL